MLRALDVVLVGVLAVESLLAGVAGLFERGFGGGLGGVCFGGKDLLVEHLERHWRERCDTALHVIQAVVRK